MCCGNISKPKKQPQIEQTIVENTTQQEVNQQSVPVQQAIVQDNINSQRAAQTLRNQYHKSRYGR